MSNAPGKFEACGPLGEKLYELSLDGCDEEYGDVNEDGWYGLLLNTGIPEAPFAIISEDIQGFIQYGAYDTEKKALHDWDRVARSESAWYEDENE